MQRNMAPTKTQLFFCVVSLLSIHRSRIILVCLLSLYCCHDGYGWVAHSARSRITSIQSLMQLSLEDQITATFQSRGLSSSSIIDAAAAMTKESCTFLGIKSLGVDYGLVRTGLAVTVGYSPKPLAILKDLSNTQLCEQVIRYAKAEEANQVIVGLPLHKNGTVAEQTNVTLLFCYELAHQVLSHLGPHVPVLLWDERYTSKEAAARAHSRNPDRYLYGTLDAEAACIILEHFYHDNGQGAQRMELEESVRAECLQRYEHRKITEQAHRHAIADERERKFRLRSEAIARAREQEALESRSDHHATTGRRKKRRKR